MTKKKDIWDGVSRDLEKNLPKSEFRTWFSQTTLASLQENAAIIGVPNKFVAQWLGETYLGEITKSFKKVIKQSPEIQFTYHRNTEDSSFSKPMFNPPAMGEQSMDLNADMTFRRITTGEFNRFALSSAREVTNKPAEIYNPLYIFSESGLGKTHLLNAIGNHVTKGNPFSRIKYYTSDSFHADYIRSLNKKTLYEFKQKCCGLDLLLFDDIQHLANYKNAQEAFLFIFNSLYNDKRQMVLASDKPPNQIKNLNSQIKSRIGSGLLAEIQIPDQDIKADIIRKKTEEDNIEFPEDVVFFLAKSSDDIKALIRNIVRLETYTSINHGQINISTVKSLIKDHTGFKVNIKEIKSITSNYFNISPSDLISQKRGRNFSYPRHLAMYLCRKHTKASLKEIGHSFGRKDHSTVLYAVRQIEKHKADKKKFQVDLRNIENLLA
ncbi:chromosomal replication initiator protein DnaA [Thermodesulfobacteriota bacterium]